MQRLIFEQSPLFLILCAALAIGLAWFLYKGAHSWGVWTNRLLFLFRASLLFIAALLLLGPIIKLITNTDVRPQVVFLVDNSQSMVAEADSSQYTQTVARLKQVATQLEDAGFETSFRGLKNESLVTGNASSDLTGAIKNIEAELADQHLSDVVLLSDGIYNTGISPLFASFKSNVHTIGLGDTTQRRDLVLQTVHYNKIAYQGNRFPVQVEVIAHALPQQDVTVALWQSGKEIGRQQKNTANQKLLTFDFLAEAAKPGIQRYDVVISPLADESNKNNNRASVFVEIVEGKKKILMVAAAPHPDLKTFRAVIELNPNYEVGVHIAGVQEAGPDWKDISKIDLGIFHQAPDTKNSTTPLLKAFLAAKKPIFMVIGQQTSLRQISSAGIAITFESFSQWDEVYGLPATDFTSFAFPENLSYLLNRFPPLTSPYGKFTIPPAKVVLHQRIGTVATERPLLWVSDSGNQRLGVLHGEGAWRWRLKEFQLNDNTEVFDSFFLKFFQYLASQDDEKKFRCFPVKNQFNDTEDVVFESQLFNDVLEPQYGPEVSLDIVDESGSRKNFSYTPSLSQPRFKVPLAAGAYRFVASITRNGKKETDQGQFSVNSFNIETQNLTADFQLLRSLATNAGGDFYEATKLDNLAQRLIAHKPASRIQSDESFYPLINLKILFAVLLLLISTEWFFRKYLGSY